MASSAPSNQGPDIMNAENPAALPLHGSRKEGDDVVVEDGLVAEPGASASRSKLRVVAIMAALFLSLFLAALDSTIVATAIPTITSHFRSASGYTWIGGAYLLANAAAGPIWAKLSDIWGRKPILLCAVAHFFLSSIICAVSKSMGMLIAGRSLQGAAGGGLILLVNIVVSDMFSLRQRSLWLGSLEFVWATASAIGPVLGGVLAQLASWRWIFYINLPTCGLTFLIILIFLDVHNPRTKLLDGIKAIDWFGSMTILALTLMTLLGLDFGGETFPWNSPKVICLIVFGLLMSVFFFYSESKLAKYPLIPLGLFRHRSNVASLAVCFFHGFMFIAAEYYLPLYYQSVQEASPLHSGLLLLPLVLTEASTGILTGILIHRTGRYIETIWAGTTLLTLGVGLLIDLDANSTLTKMIPFQIVIGLGSGFLFEPPLIALQALVSQDDTATATATLGFVRSIALCLSVVVGGVIFQNGMQIRAPALRASGLSSNITAQLSGSEAAANVMIVKSIENATKKQIVKEAFSWSLRNMWILYVSAGVCSIVATFFISKQALAKEHTETKTGLKKDSQGAVA